MALVQNAAGNWEYDDVPEVCPNGHRLSPGRVHIRWNPGEGRIYECAQCGAIEVRQPATGRP